LKSASRTFQQKYGKRICFSPPPSCFFSWKSGSFSQRFYFIPFSSRTIREQQLPLQTKEKKVLIAFCVAIKKLLQESRG
jgi:hypothetical protein